MDFIIIDRERIADYIDTPVVIVPSSYDGDTLYHGIVTFLWLEEDTIFMKALLDASALGSIEQAIDGNLNWLPTTPCEKDYQLPPRAVLYDSGNLTFFPNYAGTFAHVWKKR